MGQSQGGGTSTGPKGYSQGDGPMSPLEQGLQAVVDTFYRYAQAPAEGLEPTLDAGSFQRLLRLELGRQLRDTGQPRAVAAVFSLLDANGDERISFSEYWQLVAWLCHVLRHRHHGTGTGTAPEPPAFCCRRDSHGDKEIQP